MSLALIEEISSFCGSGAVDALSMDGEHKWQSISSRMCKRFPEMAECLGDKERCRNKFNSLKKMHAEIGVNRINVDDPKMAQRFIERGVTTPVMKSLNLLLRQVEPSLAGSTAAKPPVHVAAHGLHGNLLALGPAMSPNDVMPTVMMAMSAPAAAATSGVVAALGPTSAHFSTTPLFPITHMLSAAASGQLSTTPTMPFLSPMHGLWSLAPSLTAMQASAAAATAAVAVDKSLGFAPHPPSVMSTLDTAAASPCVLVGPASIAAPAAAATAAAPAGAATAGHDRSASLAPSAHPDAMPSSSCASTLPTYGPLGLQALSSAAAAAMRTEAAVASAASSSEPATHLSFPAPLAASALPHALSFSSLHSPSSSSSSSSSHPHSSLLSSSSSISSSSSSSFSSSSSSSSSSSLSTDSGCINSSAISDRSHQSRDGCAHCACCLRRDSGAVPSASAVIPLVSETEAIPSRSDVGSLSTTAHSAAHPPAAPALALIPDTILPPLPTPLAGRHGCVAPSANPSLSHPCFTPAVHHAAAAAAVVAAHTRPGPAASCTSVLSPHQAEPRSLPVRQPPLFSSSLCSFGSNTELVAATAHRAVGAPDGSRSPIPAALGSFPLPSPSAATAHNAHGQAGLSVPESPSTAGVVSVELLTAQNYLLREAVERLERRTEQMFAVLQLMLQEKAAAGAVAGAANSASAGAGLAAITAMYGHSAVGGHGHGSNSAGLNALSSPQMLSSQQGSLPFTILQSAAELLAGAHMPPLSLAALHARLGSAAGLSTMQAPSCPS